MQSHSHRFSFELGAVKEGAAQEKGCPCLNGRHKKGGEGREETQKGESPLPFFLPPLPFRCLPCRLAAQLPLQLSLFSFCS